MINDCEKKCCSRCENITKRTEHLIYNVVIENQIADWTQAP